MSLSSTLFAEFAVSVVLGVTMAVVPAIAATGSDPGLKRPAPQTETFALRGYRQFTHQEETTGLGPGKVIVHSFVFADPGRAGIFVSKLFSDFELTVGNAVLVLNTARGEADAIALADGGWILPLTAWDNRRVRVLVGTEKKAVLKVAAKLLQEPPLRRSAVSHPLFMDKWDRYCFGAWGRVQDITADPDYTTAETYFAWMGKIGLNSQIVGSTDSLDLATSDNLLTWQRRYFRHGPNCG